MNCFEFALRKKGAASGFSSRSRLFPENTFDIPENKDIFLISENICLTSQLTKATLTFFLANCLMAPTLLLSLRDRLMQGLRMARGSLPLLYARSRQVARRSRIRFTLKWVPVALVLGAIAFFGYENLYKSRVVLEVCGVPKVFEEAGFPANVLAAHLNDELSLLKSAASETIPGEYELAQKPDIPATEGKSHSEAISSLPSPFISQQRATGDIELFQREGGGSNPVATLEIPSTHLTVQSAIDSLRDMGFGKPIPRVQIDITDIDSKAASERHCESSCYEMTVRILWPTRNGSNSERAIFHSLISRLNALPVPRKREVYEKTINASDASQSKPLEEALGDAAIFILRNLEPLTYVAYLLNTNHQSEAKALLATEKVGASGLNLARALNMEGLLYYYDGQYVEARQSFAAAAYSGYFSPQLNDANALHYQGYFDKAVNSFKRLIDRQPHYALAHNNLAAVYIDEGRYPEAAEQLAIALKDEKDPLYYSNLGRVQWLLGDQKKAVANWEAALQRAPRYYAAYVAWAESLYESGKLEEANSQAYQAFCLARTSDPYSKWARFLLDRKDSRRSIEVLNEGLAAFPKNARLLVELGDHLRRAGECDEALNKYDQVSKALPEYAAAIIGKSYCLVDKRRGVRAKELLSGLRNDGKCTALCVRALAYAHSKEGADEESVLREGIATFPNSAELHNDLGIRLENGED